ncbi:MAG TPA: Smr/MutS family protein [Pseudolabrys sp.]|nr:Smr/MutS family protein [Pseudolabrys sp.]
MKRRGLSPDERVLWSAVTRSIAPMRAGAAAPEEDAVEAVRPAAPKPAAAPLAPPLAQEPMPPPLSPLGRRMRSRVARGKEDIDGRLDLHGLTQSEAHAALLRFLRQASGRGARLVLVITGKGARGGEGERGVLRRQVPQWLRLPEFRALVIGFEQAHVAHGGEGALYVRVRRSRE